jgi:ligand-binding SRPBCC domain-containing protein
MAPAGSPHPSRNRYNGVGGGEPRRPLTPVDTGRDRSAGAGGRRLHQVQQSHCNCHHALVPEFELVAVINAELSAVFDLSLSVDAHTKSMGGSKEKAVAGVTSGLLGMGDSVTRQARHFGLPFRMTSTIVSWDRPKSFVDEQTRGPFHCWRQEHSFEPAAGGGTRMVDTVGFASPLGPVGRAVDGLVLARYMRRLVEQRNEWLRETLEA